MKRLFAILLSIAMLMGASAPMPAAGLQLSKGLHHYSLEMEYYYQKPRPQLLKDILSAFYRSGALGKSENRMMVAAFLAQLVKKGRVKMDNLIKDALSLGRDARHTVAWCAHLSQTSLEKKYLAQLLGPEDKYLKEQIGRTPAPLEAWSINSEKTVVQMYWAAFMASGETLWLDRIINLALRYARSGDPGRHPDADFAIGAEAAASLYDFAPRHPLVVKRLKGALPGKEGGEKKMINIILEHAGN